MSWATVAERIALALADFALRRLKDGDDAEHEVGDRVTALAQPSRGPAQRGS